MINVLTIDFDVITTNLIDEYNKESLYMSNNITVDELENKLEYLKDLKLDTTIYNRLTEYLKMISKDKTTKVVFIDRHDDIVKHVPDEDFTMLNIDYHGDLISGDDTDVPAPMNCGNWAYYLFKDYKMKKYTMCQNGDFQLTKVSHDDTQHKYLLDYDVYFQGFDTLNLNDYNADIVVICKSPEYVSSRFYYLYDKWKEIFK